VKRSLSPQQKKLLSYAKDGRNTFAEAGSKSRKGIAKHKAFANRALRRAERAAMANAASRDADAFIARTGRRSWRKIPDAPLAEYVGRKLRRREATSMNKRAKASNLLKRARKVAVPRPAAYKGPFQHEGDD
jgi:hypothetical protein